MEVGELMRGLLLVAMFAGAARPEMPEQMLAAHNAVRAKLGVEPLAWSAPLAAYAQQWADHLVSTHGFQHRANARYGENLYAVEGDGAAARPDDVVRAWAGEARRYDYRANSCRDVCGHYTQVVWRATREVGCGVARSSGYEVWVCNYSPPGNVIGQRPY